MEEERAQVTASMSYSTARPPRTRRIGSFSPYCNREDYTAIVKSSSSSPLNGTCHGVYGAGTADRYVNMVIAAHNVYHPVSWHSERGILERYAGFRDELPERSASEHEVGRRVLRLVGGRHLRRQAWDRTSISLSAAATQAASS